MQTRHESSHFSGQGVTGVGKLFSNVCAMDLRLPDDKAPWSLVGFDSVRLQGIHVYHDEGVGARSVVHNSGHIEADPTDAYIVALPVTSRSQVAQGGTLAVLEPGNFLLLSTAKPFSGWVGSADSQNRFSQLLAKISGTMLRERLPMVDDTINQPISLQSGEGRIMKTMFELALAEGGSLSDTSVAYLGNVLIDAIVNATATMRPLNPAQRNISALARLRETATEYVERNLSNPRLDIKLIADQCKVSTRYLHAAFAETATGLAAYIREQRLLRCRACLRSPAYCDKSIIDIALHWGFDDPAHFSRLYKARFGHPPSKERQAR